MNKQYTDNTAFIAGVCGSKCRLAASLRVVGGTKWQPELVNRDTDEFQKLANEIEAEVRIVELIKSRPVLS